MSKYPCELVEDLLPLYVEGEVSDSTKEIVEEHIKECEKCRELLKEYKNDEIKVEELIDLPEAHTFKRWMKKLKIWGFAALIIIVIAGIAAGVIGYKAGESAKNDTLKLKTIVETFNKGGLNVKEDNSNSKDENAIFGIKPSVYTIGDSKDKLLIYMFKSFMDRDQVMGGFSDPFAIEKVQFKAKNALIVYKPNEIPKTEDDLAVFVKTKKLIGNIVFKDLNQGKEVTFKGESEHWQGTFTLKYYQNFIQDDKGFHYDGYSEKYPILKYKDKDIDSVGPVSYNYDTAAGGGGGEVDSLDNDGYIRIGGGGGNGAIQDVNKDINITVKWKDKEEHIVLKPQ
ncbi:MAG: zf-HC2 domain-containing protein [Solirubrobacterales bacterium]